MLRSAFARVSSRTTCAWSRLILEPGALGSLRSSSRRYEWSGFRKGRRRLSGFCPDFQSARWSTYVMMPRGAKDDSKDARADWPSSPASCRCLPTLVFGRSLTDGAAGRTLAADSIFRRRIAALRAPRFGPRPVWTLG